MSSVVPIPDLPLPLRLLLYPAPLYPLRLVMRRVAENVRRTRPELFARLEVSAGKTYLVDPVDFPFCFRLELAPDRAVVEPVRRFDKIPWDARIAGPFAALIGLVHGAYDGDALFFSRDIVIEGDTEAVLALRNAVDDAEIDLAEEVAEAFGLANSAINRAARGGLASASRILGVALTRVEWS